MSNQDPNALIPTFLMACYAYYTLGKRIMSDPEFDALVAKIKVVWDTIDHPHKSLITKSHLDATTGYDIQYPTIVKHLTHLELQKLNAQKS